jgi:hypothetical protein
VMARIGLVEGGSDDGNRASACAHGGFVSCRVDPYCEAREDDETAAYELRAQFGGERSPLMRSAPRAHHSDARAAEEARVSGGVQCAPARKRDGRPDNSRLNRFARRED